MISEEEAQSVLSHKMTAFLTHCKIRLVYNHNTEEVSIANLQNCWSSLQLASSLFVQSSFLWKAKNKWGSYIHRSYHDLGADSHLHPKKGTRRCYKTHSIEITRVIHIWFFNSIKKMFYSFLQDMTNLVSCFIPLPRVCLLKDHRDQEDLLWVD